MLFSRQRSSPLPAAGKALLLIMLFTWTAVIQAQESQLTQRRNEMVVSGRVQGPPLWQVRQGDHTLWIFGLLNPLPKHLDWESSRVERVIARSQAYLEAPGYTTEERVGLFAGLGLWRDVRSLRSNMPGSHLRQVLPADVYTAMQAVTEVYGPRGQSVYRMRPLFAAREIWQAGMKHAGLERPRRIEKQIERLVRRQKLTVLSAEYAFQDDLRSLLEEVNRMPLYDEISCLDAMVESIATDLQAMRQRAQSWAHGYMGDIYTGHYPNPQADCFSALTAGERVSSIRAAADALWLSQAEEALTTYASTFAVLPMYQILSEDGLLEALRKRGYEVIEP